MFEAIKCLRYLPNYLFKNILMLKLSIRYQCHFSRLSAKETVPD